VLNLQEKQEGSSNLWWNKL